MNECPHCGAEFRTDAPAFEHVARYHVSITAKCSECDRAVHLVPQTVITLQPATSSEDSWGQRCRTG